MKKNCLLSICLIISAMASLEASYTISNGRLMNTDDVATMSVQEHHSAAVEAYQQGKWEELVRQSIILTKNFPSTTFAQEALFYLGVAYFNLKDFDLANQNFSKYLHRQTTPKHFEEAIQYKYKIAEQFQKGARKHMMGWQSMPKWIPAQDEALSIYEEVITALPNDELAAKAIFGKAQILLEQEYFKESVESFQTLIRRFPKNFLAIESYIGIGKVYLKQCQTEYPDRDFLDLAEINLRKFRLDFPKEEKYVEVERMFLQMQEIYAQSLYETGQFFERTKKPQASLLYYNKIVTQFPQTKIAALSQERLEAIKKKTGKQQSSLAEKKSDQKQGEVR
jgi:TolA-binding protein